ncbi:chorismate lyase [Candidimonas humi]|uniref:Probable chorismate pyruvate-lyase n=1 Tax=Candidimonas humi TaxID=683355 RepID=A0ABV8NR71_9BURK|nr:chorismate lyase [Candidimonas humi]MBV6303662.1 chorismate lyase [Candidimonas humi]
MSITPDRRAGWLAGAAPTLDREQKYWLTRPGALTAGLQGLGQVRLRVLRERVEGLCRSEAWMLGLAPNSPIWAREIVMSIDGIDSVMARSLTPLAASHSWWQGMRRLRSRPLADMLYADPRINRSPFFTRGLDRWQPMYRALRAGLPAARYPAPALLARCSVFRRGGQPLSVAECFLPEFWRVAARSATPRSGRRHGPPFPTPDRT